MPDAEGVPEEEGAEVPGLSEALGLDSEDPLPADPPPALGPCGSCGHPREAHVPSGKNSLAENCSDGDCPCHHWWREECAWCRGDVAYPLTRLLLKGIHPEKNIGCISCRRIWMQKQTVNYELIELPVNLDGQ